MHEDRSSSTDFPCRDGQPTVDSHEAFYDGRGNMPLGGEEINSGYKARIFVTPLKSIARTAIEKESCEHLIRDTGSECSWSCSADSPLDRCTLTTCGGGQSITGTNELLHLLKAPSKHIKVPRFGVINHVRF